jgi:thiol-disulfide isomerase/thioredoxin
LKLKTAITLFIFSIQLSVISQTKTVAPVTVFVFLSETCPICQSYTLPLKELYKKYHVKQVSFIGVFPNQEITQEEIADFKKKYAIPFKLMADTGRLMVMKFNATITPEVFVETTEQQLIYTGRIDNSFYAVGKRRKLVTTHELEDALFQYASGTPVTVSKTEAVGCIIPTLK